MANLSLKEIKSKLGSQDYKIRIDFLDELEEMGFKPIVPREVLQELKDLRLKDKTSRNERTAIDVAFQLFEQRKVRKKKIGGKNVDYGLIAKGGDGTYVATLDAGIKNKIANKIVIDKAKNGLRVLRN